jgi:hypothetical protein
MLLRGVTFDVKLLGSQEDKIIVLLIYVNDISVIWDFFRQKELIY